MSKPDHIVLLRHGQSIGNEDKSLYANVPDFALTLTKLGHRQAREAGKKLRKLFGPERVMFYISPFWRTRQTFEEVAKSFPRIIAREDPRLREQEWGHLRSREATDFINQQRDSYSSFYYRIVDGESVADVYDRCSSFLDTLFRDFEKPRFPRNAIIVSHGMLNRALLMRWLHYSVEQFEKLANPHNCEYYILRLQSDGKYHLTEPPPQYDKVKHQYQYPGKVIAYPYIKGDR